MQKRKISYPRIIAPPAIEPSAEWRHIALAMKTLLIRAHATGEVIYSVEHKGETSVCLGKKFYDESSEQRRAYNKALAALVRRSLVDLQSGRDAYITAFKLSAAGMVRATHLFQKLQDAKSSHQ